LEFCVLPYWLLFTIYAAGALNTRRSSQVASSSPLLVFAGVVTAVLIGFRYDVGGDWENYQNIFFNIGFLTAFETALVADPAYALLNWLSHAIGADIWFVNLICAAIFVWGLVKFCNQQPNPWLALAVAVPYLIIVVAMGYTRQAAAIGLLLVGFAGLHSHSIVRFAVLALVAATFHKTAIAVLPLVAIGAAQRGIVGAGIIGLVGALGLFIFVDRGMTIIMNTYVEQDYDAQGAMVRVFMNLLPATLFLLFQRRFGMDEPERKLWRNFSFAAFGTLALLFLVASTTVADRIAIYLIPLQIVIFSRLPYAFPDRGRPNGSIVIAVLSYSALVQYVWLTQAAHAVYWLPYRFFPFWE
jgi:hypothetical protein